MTDDERWARLSGRFEHAVRKYHRARGAAPDAASVLSTVRTNTELVPKRSRALMDALATLGGVPSLAGRTVLEVGCGFGALAAYLAMTEAPARLVAIDERADLVATARACTDGAGLDVLSFEQIDMRAMHDLPDGAFDVVLLNNSFIYLPTRREMERALDELARVTADDGVILLSHANRWRWREPFTGDPLVHLLPPRVARWVSRLTGWRHNHGRVRLISPVELRRRLRACGYHDIRVSSAGAARPGGAKRYFGRFYAIGARRRERSPARS